MAVKFFGQYLLEKGAVSKDDLLRAIELQEKTNLKFGETAMAMGLMTREDVDKVHQAQQSEDLRFGDLALKLGLITQTQMEQVLTRQSNCHLYVGEALIRIGGLKADELSRHLGEFKADQAPYTVDRIRIPANIPAGPTWEMVADLTYKMLTRIAGISVRPGPAREIRTMEPNAVVVGLDFEGTVRGRFLFAASIDVQKAIARALLREEEVENEPQEVLDDTVMEFANIVLGNVAAKAAQRGDTLEIAPPQAFHPGPEGIPVPAGMRGLVFPIVAAGGGMVEMAVFIGK